MTPDPPDWLGPAKDCLEQHGLDDAAKALDRLERAVEMLELIVRENPRPYHWQHDGRHHRVVKLIAAHRGETGEEALRRLSRVELEVVPVPSVLGQTWTEEEVATYFDLIDGTRDDPAPAP